MLIQKLLPLFCLCVTYTSALHNERIIGGWVAVEGQFGHQVSIRDHYKHICGGTIIDKRTILTAAHCIESHTLSDLLVIAGTSYLSIGGQAYDVPVKIIHREYNSTTGDNDLAILKTAVPIQFSKRMRVARLPVQPPSSEDRVYMTGWGWRTFPGDYSEDLRYLSIKMMPLDECAALLGEEHPVTDKHVCTNPSAGEGICYGDIGNGIFDYNDYFIGMAIWSHNPCGAGKPDLFTNIYLYTDWIKENMTPE